MAVIQFDLLGNFPRYICVKNSVRELRNSDVMLARCYVYQCVRDIVLSNRLTQDKIC